MRIFVTFWKGLRKCSARKIRKFLSKLGLKDTVIIERFHPFDFQSPSITRSFTAIVPSHEIRTYKKLMSERISLPKSYADNAFLSFGVSRLKSNPMTPGGFFGDYHKLWRRYAGIDRDNGILGGQDIRDMIRSGYHPSCLKSFSVLLSVISKW